MAIVTKTFRGPAELHFQPANAFTENKEQLEVIVNRSTESVFQNRMGLTGFVGGVALATAAPRLLDRFSPRLPNSESSRTVKAITGLAVLAGLYTLGARLLKATQLPPVSERWTTKVGPAPAAAV
jgi:hypothetical protein